MNIHKWYSCPPVRCPKGDKLTVYKCAKCHKEVAGKHPSQTERCMGRP